MYKTVIERKGKHGMGYRYLMTKVFHYLNIPLGVVKLGTTKQSFPLSSLVECYCIEGKGNIINKVYPLIAELDKLKN